MSEKTNTDMAVRALEVVRRHVLAALDEAVTYGGRLQHLEAALAACTRAQRTLTTVAEPVSELVQ